jgi:LmbE family N-acetylglucosaminyl deacetylase
VVRAIAGAGTPEAEWLPFLAGLPPYGRPAGPVTLLAPHPDDEVLAAGGLLALLAGAGVPVRVVSVTDGEASNPGGSVPPAELAALRAAETAAALAALGVTDRTRLGLPDGGAAGLEAPVAALELTGTVLAPWRGDGHPDHEAVGRGAATAAARTGAALVEYPVWAWHWAAPGDPAVPWERARRLDLPPGIAARKARALAEFRSQTAPLGPLAADAPVLPPAILARFTRPYEVLFG